MIRQAHKALSRPLAEALARRGVAFKHYYYLRALFEEDGITQMELSLRVGMERATVTRVLDTMEREGLVRRARDPDDRRKINVYLTPRARRLREPLVSTIAQINEVMLQDISAAEFAQFRRTLDRMVDNVNHPLDELLEGEEDRRAVRRAG